MLFKVLIGLIWANLSKTARIAGPKICELAMFSLTGPPLNSDFVQYILENFQIGPFWSDWQTLSIFQNGPKYEASNT